ncbi:MAG: hypothetical protein ACC707_19525 [Thiohalomonadales bacterium]
MRQIIIDSIRVVNGELALVILAGLCGIRIVTGFMTYVSLATLIVMFFISIVVYGRIVAKIRGDAAPLATELIRDNWFNYLLVAFVLALPVMLFKQIANLGLISPVSFILAKESLDAVVHMAAIYVLPIVFIKKQHVVAIFSGIAYLSGTLKRSFPILLLVAVLFIFKATVVLSSIHILPPEAGMLSLIPYMLVVNVIFTYLAFIVFAVASAFLVKRSVEFSENGA